MSAFSYSWKRQRDLRVVQKLTREKVEGGCSYTCTRWGSKVEMMEQIIEQQDAIRVVLSQDRNVLNLVPTWQDFDVLESVVEAVKGFSDLIDLLSGEKRVTGSAIKPLVEVVNKKIAVPKEEDNPLTLEVKERIRNDLNTRYQSEEMSVLLDICSFLDPRFKDKFCIEDGPVVKLIEEIETYDDNEILAACRTPSQGDLQAPRKKRGKFSSIFCRDSSPMENSSIGTSDRV